MDGPDRSPLFLGDLDDPWVAAIAQALPSSRVLKNCRDQLPDELDLAWGPRTLIVHRANLTSGDARRMERMAGSAPARPKVVVCTGLNTRYRETDLWLPLCSSMIPEATAAESIGRHLAGYQLTVSPRLRVTVESSNDALKRALEDSARALGYRVEGANEVSPAAVLLWDVPTLEAHWCAELAHRAKSRRVLALFGFADRQLVTQAKVHGASACLELPYDYEDLGFVLERIGRRRVDAGHTIPPGPSAPRNVGTRAVAVPNDSLYDLG